MTDHRQNTLTGYARHARSGGLARGIRILVPVILPAILAIAGAGCAKHTPPDSVQVLAPGQGELHPVNHIAHQRIDECSGIIHLDGAFWVHNDSGDQPTLYRSLDLSFTDIEVLPVPGASAVDWEDITDFEGDVLACDIGDNGRRREHLTLYRVRYLPPGSGEKSGRVELVATNRYRYPDEPHDAEAAFVVDGKLHVVTKDRGEGTQVYRFETLQDASELGEDAFNVPAHVGTLDIEGEQVTGGAADPKSRTVVLLTYGAIFRYPFDGLEGQPAATTQLWARQCESICMCDGRLIFTNEQRDVFVVEDYLSRGLDAILPPKGHAVLAALSPDASANGAGDVPPPALVEIPLQKTVGPEMLSWGLDGDRLRIDGRMTAPDSLERVRVDPARIGSAVLLMFGREPQRRVTAEETILAVGQGVDGEFGVWTIDLTGAAMVIAPLPDARVEGTIEGGMFAFELSLPAAALLGSPLPDRFLFDARGLGLRDASEPYFSGPDQFSAMRPFVWGEVVVERP